MSESWLEQFEVRLELLEQRILSPEVPFSEVIDLARHTFSALGTAASLDVYIIRPARIEQFASDGTTSVVESEVGQLRQLLSSADLPTNSNLYVGIHQLAGDVELACRFTVADNVAPESSCAEGANAICAVVASLISRRLLSQYESNCARQSNLVAVVSQLAAASSFAEVASILAQDGANVLGDCRISVLGEVAGSLSIQAITGISTPNSTAETVNELERFAVQCAEQQRCAEWLSVAEAASISANTGPTFAASNVKQVQVVSLADSEEATSFQPCMIIEVFGTTTPDENSVQQLVNAASPIVQRHQRSKRSMWSRFPGHRPARQMLSLMVGLLLLFVIPADFEIKVDGQVQATKWRRIYAPSNGTVDTVQFENEQRVSETETLLQMSNPDIELELQRVLGNIQTTRAKLATTETSRITGTNPQASSDAQLLKVELANLLKDESLIRQQSAELTITAPFDGTVFLQDPQKELSVRPVQRGQLLFQVVAEDSGWQLELDIPENLRQYLPVGDNGLPGSCAVQYTITAAPDASRETTLTTVENAVQVRNGVLVCRATALIESLPQAHQRPGTSVTAKIYCGRRSLGFVWFREVIEFWQQFKFAWL